MKNLGFDWHFIGRKLLIGLIFLLFDSAFIALGTGLYIQTTLILVYRWALYTPSAIDLKLIVFLGIILDAVFLMPLGLHSFLYILIYILLQSQERYLSTAHQYIRWFIFLGVILIFNQLEFILQMMLGQTLVVNLFILYSIMITFAFYPVMFRFLQIND
jgi:cell shape-determining protein MreD